jgi:hypothetical protein
MWQLLLLEARDVRANRWLRPRTARRSRRRADRLHRQPLLHENARRTLRRPRGRRGDSPLRLLDIRHSPRDLPRARARLTRVSRRNSRKRRAPARVDWPNRCAPLHRPRSDRAQASWGLMVAHHAADRLSLRRPISPTRGAGREVLRRGPRSRRDTPCRNSSASSIAEAALPGALIVARQRDRRLPFGARLGPGTP